jgi:hypothetical protein
MEFDEGLSQFLVLELVSMGFDEGMSRWAVEQSGGGKTLDELVTWMFENQGVYSPTVPSGELNEGHKMVIVVRSDLGMSTGKIAAQCVHGALGCVQSASSLAVVPWRDSGEATICLRCNSEEELHKLRNNAEAAGMKSLLCPHKCMLVSLVDGISFPQDYLITLYVMLEERKLLLILTQC